MPTTTNTPKPTDSDKNIGDNEAALEQHNAEMRRRRAYAKKLGTPDGQTPEPDHNGVLGDGM